MQRIGLDASSLAEMPELTSEALARARANPEVGCVIDRVEPGLPLILSFGFLAESDPPLFDFFGRSKKLEDRFQIRYNRILVRDLVSAWYHRGVVGLGYHVDEIASSLRRLIRTIAPGRVMTIGQSMGGYAAIMFGMLLDADRIVAFGTLTHLDPAEAKCYGDRRYLQWMEALNTDPPRSGHYDLLALGEALDYRGELHLVFGTHPGNHDGLSSNHDAIHALRMMRLPNVFLYPYPESRHAIVEWLIDHQQIDDVLAHLLVDLDDFCRPRSQPMP